MDTNSNKNFKSALKSTTSSAKASSSQGSKVKIGPNFAGLPGFGEENSSGRTSAASGGIRIQPRARHTGGPSGRHFGAIKERLAKTQKDNHAIHLVDIPCGNGKVSGIHIVRPGTQQTERQRKIDFQAAVSRRLSVSVSSTPNKMLLRNRSGTALAPGTGSGQNRQALSPISGSMADSSAQDFLGRYPMKFENSYQLAPKMGVPKPNEIREELHRIMDEELNGFSGNYQMMTARYYAKNLAENVKHSVKDFVDSRYKIVAFCQIGQNQGQDLRFKTGFLWNRETDTLVDIVHKNEKTGLFIVLNVYFLYLD